MFYITIFGICYTLLQLPFSIYYMRKKKYLIIFTPTRYLASIYTHMYVRTFIYIHILVMIA